MSGDGVSDVVYFLNEPIVFTQALKITVTRMDGSVIFGVFLPPPPPDGSASRTVGRDQTSV